MSLSSNPTLYPFSERNSARFAETVLFPTPPLPLRTINLCFILLRFLVILVSSNPFFSRYSPPNIYISSIYIVFAQQNSKKDEAPFLF